jgi:hypothetical protein
LTPGRVFLAAAFFFLGSITLVCDKDPAPRITKTTTNLDLSARLDRKTAATGGVLLPAVPRGQRAKLVARYGKLPLSFEANEGQTDARVNFQSRGRGYSLFLTSNEAVIALRKAVPQAKGQRALAGRKFPRHQKEGASRGTVIRMELAGANFATRVGGEEELPGKVNYFIGNDPAKWRTNVPTYAKVKYEGVYPGVDLVYYGNQGRLEYDFIVAARADASTIRLQLKGAGKLQVNGNGDLFIGNDGKEIAFQKPLIYQQVAGTKREVGGSYLIASKNQIAFQLGEYDHSRALVIDPVLVYSTYLGGNRADQSYGIAVDAAGNAYVTGYTQSTNFPTTNARQGVIAGPQNVFISKLNASGSALVYSTYLGGDSYDYGASIAVDSAGNAYVTGDTHSSNFPTVNALQGALAGSENAFVSKLNPSGSALVYSTYLGGGNDVGQGIAVDSSGNAYVTGFTTSSNFPTANALQGALAGSQNAFVSKLNASGSALLYSTYLGGSNYDYAEGIGVDPSGNAYVAGYTGSTNFPTANAFQSTFGGGVYDAFVSKLNASGSALVYSTYLGGNSYDLGQSIAVDAAGNAYVTGFTTSSTFPTVNPLQAALTGTGGVFVSKLNASGSALVYSTYLGGASNYDIGAGIAVDTAGNAYITGDTNSSIFPTTVNAFQGSYGGSGDSFVSEIDASGSALVYSSYLGGSGEDQGYGIAVDTAGNAYVTGWTTSSNFPTVNALQATCASCGDLADAFVAKISASPLTATATELVSSLDPAVLGQTVTLTATVVPQGTGTGVPAGRITFEDGSTQLSQVVLNANGQATFTTAAFTVGSHPISALYSGDVNFAPSTGSLTQTINGPIASLSLSALNFGQQFGFSTSSPQAISVTNTGNLALHVSAVSITGQDAVEFAQTNTCVAAPVSPGSSCQISVTFTPTSPGAFAANLSITDDATGSPQNVTLTGIGLVPLVSQQSSVGFGNRAIGTTSASQSASVTNSGNTAMTISGITVTGPNNGDFSEANLCPLAPATLAPGASCTINVTFAPIAEGVRYASLTITDNAPFSPQLVALIGTGTGQSSNIPPRVAFLGGGSPSLFLELGQAAVNLNGGSSAACTWTQNETSAIVARDSRTTPATDEQGNIWVVWSPGTGTCTAPNGNFIVYSYMSLDTVGADRCYFEVDSSGIPGCTQLVTIAANTPGANLLCYPTSSNCGFFGDTAGGIPASIINTITNQHWFAAGTELLPTDAKFANYRMLTACGSAVYREPFDQGLRQVYGLGYQTSTPGIGAPVESNYSSATVQVLDFNISGNDPFTGLAAPAYSVSTVGAQPVIIAVSGPNLKGARDITGFGLTLFYQGILGRTTDLVYPSGTTAATAPVTTLVPEPQSGLYNVMEYSVVNSSQFHGSQDDFNCSGGSVNSNPMNLQSTNGVYPAYRRRVIGNSEMVGQLQGATTDTLGYFFWSQSNASNFTDSNGRYLTVDGADPLQSPGSYATPGVFDGIIPGSDSSHPVSNVTFAGVNSGDYPIWSTLRIVSQSPTPASVINLIEAAQTLNSIQHDFIPVSQLNAWHSHYYIPAIFSGTAANGTTMNPATPNDLCPGYLPEFGGDVGGANVTKQVNLDFCQDFSSVSGLISKSN